MTISDKIIYSQILYHALWEGGNLTFDYDGNLSIDRCAELSDSLIPIPDGCTQSKICETTGVSRRQYFISISHLSGSDYITTNSYGERYITLIDNIASTFFELRVESGLKGTPLIVYSYLANKTRRYGWVDKYHDAIARELNISPLVLANCLRTIADAGHLEKRKRGHQVLLRAI